MLLTIMAILQDTFEDAVDTGSVRSLTGRKTSLARQTRGESQGPESDADEASKSVAEAHSPDAKHVEPAAESEKKTVRRLSKTTVADLDNVNLDDDSTMVDKGKSAVPLREYHTRHVTQRVLTLPPPDSVQEKTPVEKDQPPSKTLSLSSFTSALPSMPWSPPASDAAAKSTLATNGPPPSNAPAAAIAPTRKLSSPFAWLSRNSSSKEPNVTSPPVTSPRRNTASSVATLTSNPEMMLSKLDEERELGGPGSRNSLKDRFKQLRMREEAGVPSIVGEDDKAGGAPKAGPGLGVIIPAIGSPDEKDGSLAVQPPLSPLPPSPNPSLAPGTASGVSVGPSSMPHVPVDWDLWQSVVYEGPAVVARTSPEELNKAIATGIPNAIRGVIWQVLAQSKNEDLEEVYHDLLVRGTDQEKSRQSNGTPSILDSHSSASSVHSDPGANGSGTASPTDKETEGVFRAPVATVAVDRKKKEKDDMIMIQKLEKIIRKDMGARTSYSKYAAAQGLQEGLFGICKAYALYDEGVGYAQGMNFLVMPLLFNVSGHSPIPHPRDYFLLSPRRIR